MMFAGGMVQGGEGTAQEAGDCCCWLKVAEVGEGMWTRGAGPRWHQEMGAAMQLEWVLLVVLPLEMGWHRWLRCSSVGRGHEETICDASTLQNLAFPHPPARSLHCCGNLHPASASVTLPALPFAL